MKRIDLIKVDHDVRIGQTCGNIKPNVTEDSIFFVDGKPIGFYLKHITGDAKKYLEIANKEFLSTNVDKTVMSRGLKEMALSRGELPVEQYSTIIGSRAPKPHMRMNYPSKTQVHANPKSKTFIKAMLLLCREGEELIKKHLPEQYEIQKKIFEEVPDKWKFGNLFTSSISNFNINANYHKDNANFPHTVNIIFTKRKNSIGGCLNVPDYNATIEQADNSILVYPAWLNIHGVTPIIPTFENGYRNSLIFYPLKAFKNLK